MLIKLSELNKVEMKMKWRVINSGRCSPAENMAIDEAIMQGVIRGVSTPVIRFYDWDPATVSCGYNQVLAKEVDLDLIASQNLAFVRRPTGGRVVLHDHEVTYAVIASSEGKLAGNVTESYAEISRALARGLNILGVQVELEKGSLTSAHQRQEANPCFASSSRFELSYQRKKIVGSAQVRKDGVLLQHGSILLDYDQSKLAYIMPNLDDDKRQRMADYLARKTVAINQVLTRTVSYDEAVLALTSGFEQEWQSDDFEIVDRISREENNFFEKLMNTKYLTEGWNNRK